MKKIVNGIIVICTALLLCGCDDDPSNKYKATQFYTGNFTENSDITVYDYNDNKELVPMTGTLSPFNTFFQAVLFQLKKDNVPSTFRDDFQYLSMKYHALYDRHYFYKENDKLINNMRVINESYGTGDKIRVDSVLFNTLKDAVEMTKFSNGLFNISIGDLSEIWNEQIDKASTKDSDSKDYQESINQNRWVYEDPSSSLVEKGAKAVLSYDELKQYLVLDSTDSTVTFNSVPRLTELNIVPSLTLGGVGKGYAIQKIAEQFSSYNVLLNGGSSSLKFTDTRIDGNSWGISFTNPLYNEILSGPNGPSGVSELNSTEVEYHSKGEFGISTSGYYEQYFYATQEDGSYKRRCHIINPLTGYSESFFDAVTIKMSDAGLCDMYTTALMNTNSLDEANKMLEELNKNFNTDAAAVYFVRERNTEKGTYETCYVPNTLFGDFSISKDLENDKITNIVKY